MGRPKSEKWSVEERTKAVLAVLRGEETLAATARRYGVSETALAKWREAFLEGGKLALSGPAKSESCDVAALEAELAERNRLIGEITVANMYLKKKTGQLRGGPEVRDELLGMMKGGQRLVAILKHLPLCVASCYRTRMPKSGQKSRGPEARAVPEEHAKAIKAMARDNPWYGYKRIAVMCRRQKGLAVTDRQVWRVFKTEGLFHKPKRSPVELQQAQKLLELLPTRPNGLWQTDVTYLHLPGHGWWYAVTVIDYFSRYLLALYLTPSYIAKACVEALKQAQDEAARLGMNPEDPVILVTDNGSSFLAKTYQKYLGSARFSHVRIAYRTPTQLGLLERFHRTLKSEEVYWNWYESPADARDKLEAFRQRYNTLRPHWALRPSPNADPLVPHEVYAEGHQPILPAWQGWAKAAKAKLEEMHAPQSRGELEMAS